ncbi:MAG TPA: phospholipase C, phosphocholine-specific [Candidatus Binatia bacterium]|jgi:phospholipase C|nr:phospholipase C, phosphocholine-specific [Candidatus Binatia bacterium]
MPTFSRRLFLQMTGAALAASAFPPSIRRALAIPANTQRGSIMDVEHVVILMQENRSFDHYFGTLPGVRGFGDRITIPLPGGRSVWEQRNGAGTAVLPYHLDAAAGNAQRVNGAPHSWGDAHNAWNDGATGHWPQFKQPWSMGYYTDAELPFQFALAQAFTICDAYHCSVHGSTNPNRLFMFTGMNDPGATGGGPAITNVNDSIGLPETGFTWTTYAERLEAAGVSWKVYQDLADNFSDNSLAGFRQYRQPFFDGTPSPLVQKGLSTTLTQASLDGLRNDVVAGTLPQVSWIVAPAGYSEHPGPSSPVQGGWYTQEVLNALTAIPDVWSKTVLLVMFDENDGYFDHVPPPSAPSRNPDLSLAGASTVDDASERHTDGLVYGPGPRVPMCIVSPWSRGGWVDSQAFDHTSIIRFLEERFGVAEPNISAWRRTVLGDLTSAFDFNHPNRKPFPTLPSLTRAEANAIRNAQQLLPQVPIPLGGAGTLPIQPAGVSHSRPLPYELHVDATVSSDVQLTFRSTGAAAAVFHVYDRLDLAAVPRRYTVGSGTTLDDTWQPGVDGRYDLWVMGPNGFLRHFEGTAPSSDGLEVQVTAARKVSIRLVNDGATECTFTLTPNAYQRSPKRVRVAAGAERVRFWSLARGHRWYDVTVTCDAAPTFARRFAGRAENGRRGVTDPAMGT